jgi:hypothetical protein
MFKIYFNKWLPRSVALVNLCFFYFLNVMHRFVIYNFKPKVLTITMANTSTEWIKASINLLASNPISSNPSPTSIVSREEAHGSASPLLCAIQGLPCASRSQSPSHSRASLASTHGSKSPPLPSSSASHDEPHIHRQPKMQRSPQISSSGRVASKSSSHGLTDAHESVSTSSPKREYSSTTIV